MDKIYKERCRELLWSGDINGIKCYIMTYGTHPCCYIDISNIEELKEEAIAKGFSLEIPVHGGVTYVENFLAISSTEKIEGNFIGWDYAHFKDYCFYSNTYAELNNEGKKYTLEELIKEVENACDYIIKKYKKSGEKVDGQK